MYSFALYNVTLDTFKLTHFLLKHCPRWILIQFHSSNYTIIYFKVTLKSQQFLNFRLNSALGWCGEPEAFTYVTVDLGSIHRVKAIVVKVRPASSHKFPTRQTEYFIIILLTKSVQSWNYVFCIISLRLSSFYQGVITDDVVGRPTELRFFYKEQEEANYVVYFPNFNLTKRDPGKEQKKNLHFNKISFYPFKESYLQKKYHPLLIPCNLLKDHLSYQDQQLPRKN